MEGVETPSIKVGEAEEKEWYEAGDLRRCVKEDCARDVEVEVVIHEGSNTPQYEADDE
jgi:hypothetical protein